MPGHGGNQVRVLDLLVQVPDEGLPRRVGGSHLVQWSCHILARLRVKHPDHTVDSHVFENLLYFLVVAEMRESREQRFFQALVPFQYIQSLLVKRDPYRARVLQLGLLGNVLHATVHDIRLGQPVQVTDTAADQALEHEDVTIYRIAGTHAA